MLVVNLYGGPGTGKSTTATGVFSILKRKGYNVEYVSEYAKDKVWDRHEAIFDNQIYIFAKQYHKIFKLNNQVDAVITDAPILLSLIYNNNRYKNLEPLVKETYNSFDNYDVFLRRTKEYNPSGRNQTEEEAKELDARIEQLLITENVEYDTKISDVDGVAISELALIVAQKIELSL